MISHFFAEGVDGVVGVFGLLRLRLDENGFCGKVFNADGGLQFRQCFLRAAAALGRKGNKFFLEELCPVLFNEGPQGRGDVGCPDGKAEDDLVIGVQINFVVDQIRCLFFDSASAAREDLRKAFVFIGFF